MFRRVSYSWTPRNDVAHGLIWKSLIRYMLRYLKAVQMMKQIIDENNLTVMTTIARYACAYEAIAKPDWWNKSKRLVFYSACSNVSASEADLNAHPARAPSSSRVLIFATSPAISAEKSIFRPSWPTHWSGTRMPAIYRRCPSMRRRFPRKTGSRE